MEIFKASFKVPPKIIFKLSSKKLIDLLISTTYGFLTCLYKCTVYPQLGIPSKMTL
uniref:Uncharacterized protein n=1 Tax=Anguilla anguilla TaxID=7936 RepID=A0A0E9SRU2_ANGAN